MSTNLVPFSSDGGFTTAGNITTASYASPAPTISGFSTVSADNFRLMDGDITGGIATVVDDGINSIAQAPGAQMDVYGFPFSQITRGQLTISGVATPSEVNGTWYYQSVNTNTYQIYTDSTYSTLVDATGWSAYTGGGTVAITKQVPAANIVINTNGYFSTFDNTGNLTVPGRIVQGNTQLSLNENGVGAAYLTASTDDSTALYMTTTSVQIYGNTGVSLTSSGENGVFVGSANTRVILDSADESQVGNVAVQTDTGGLLNTWTFDTTGVLTFPSLANISGSNFNAGTASATVALNAFSPAGNTVSVQAQGNTSSAVISIFSNAGPVTSNWTFTTAPLDPSESFLYVPNGGAISTPDATGGEGGKNIFIQAGASDPETWNSNPGGELMLKGGYGSFGDGGGGPGGNVNIEGGPSSDSHAGNVNISSGGNTWVFDYTGNLVLPNNTFTVNYANGTAVSLSGSYGNANVAANLAAFGSNPISTTGNITTGGSLIRTGAITRPAWTTSGVGFQLPTAIYTDNTTAAGNLASSYIHTIGSPTIAFSNAVSLTAATTLFVAAPTAGTNATIGNTFAITANGSISTTANVLVDGNIYYNGISGSIRSLPGFAGAGSNGTWGVFDHNVPTGGYKYVNVGTGQTISNSNTQIYIGSQYGICNTTVYGNLVAANNTSLGNTATVTTANYQIGYRDVPQVSFTGNTTIAATDAGKHYYSTLSTANVLTIANNTSVGWSVGTAITVVNRGTANITIAQGTGVSLYLAGNSTAANRVLGTYGMATLMNVAANVWMINGTGLS